MRTTRHPEVTRKTFLFFDFVGKGAPRGPISKAVSLCLLLLPPLFSSRREGRDTMIQSLLCSINRSFNT